MLRLHRAAIIKTDSKSRGTYTKGLEQKGVNRTCGTSNSVHGSQKNSKIVQHSVWNDNVLLCGLKVIHSKWLHGCLSMKRVVTSCLYYARWTGEASQVLSFQPHYSWQTKQSKGKKTNPLNRATQKKRRGERGRQTGITMNPSTVEVTGLLEPTQVNQLHSEQVASLSQGH